MAPRFVQHPASDQLGRPIRAVRRVGVAVHLAVHIAAPLAAWLALAPAAVAQPVRGTISRSAGPGAPRVNACAELESTPTPLTNVPEGMALLRLKRELEGAMVTMEKQRQLQGEQVLRMSQLQRGVDSAMQIIVRYMGPDGGAPGGGVAVGGAAGFGGSGGGIVTVRRGDSTRTVPNGGPVERRQMFILTDSLVRVQAQLPTAIVRALQPRVAAFAIEAEAALMSRTASASGYVGFSLSGSQMRVVSPQGVITSHCEYPLVESVDAGSPAERAGIVSGDTVVAYNGRDVTQQAVNYPELLVPGSTVRVRLRRGTRSREVPVTVAARTDERTQLQLQVRPTPPRTGGTPAVSGTVLEAPIEFRTMRSAAPSGSGTPPGVNIMLSPSGAGVAALAGAQFVNIDEQFAESLGVDAGVLVLRVAPGTPSAEAGLRAGDVVTTANGARLRDVGMLRALLSGSVRELRLVVQSRTAGERVVVLRLR